MAREMGVTGRPRKILYVTAGLRGGGAEAMLTRLVTAQTRLACITPLSETFHAVVGTASSAIHLAAQADEMVSGLTGRGPPYFLIGMESSSFLNSVIGVASSLSGWRISIYPEAADRSTDMEAGRAAGRATVFIDVGYNGPPPDAPDYGV
jgi:hypothetical protein